MGKLVVQVDEVYEAGNWDLANKLKPLITEPTVSANIKYGPQIEIENYARLLMFSVARQSGWEHSDNQDGHFGGRGGRMIVAGRR